MTRIKKNAPNRQEMKHRRRKPNIPELVYKFLVANEAFDNTKCHLVNKCRCCDQEKHHDEVVDSISQSIGRNTDYKIKQEWHKDSDRISKLHNIKQCHISKDLPISYLQKFVDGKSTRKREARKYMKKVLDFGIESGYLIPSDSTYRILRVSSNLLKSDSQRSKISTCDMDLFQNRDTPIMLEDLQEQKRRQRKRGWRRRGQRLRSALRTRHRSRRRRRRSRSRSCSRGRRRHSSSQNPEEIAEMNDYKMDENDPKSNIHMDDLEGNQRPLDRINKDRILTRSNP